MSTKKREDSTESLIREGEALRASAASGKSRPPRTRQLVRDAERLIGRPPAVAAALPVMRWVIVLSVLAIAIAGLVFVLT